MKVNSTFGGNNSLVIHGTGQFNSSSLRAKALKYPHESSQTINFITSTSFRLTAFDGPFFKGCTTLMQQQRTWGTAEAANINYTIAKPPYSNTSWLHIRRQLLTWIILNIDLIIYNAICNANFNGYIIFQ